MFDFPNNPSDGERVVHPNGNTYEYVLLGIQASHCPR